MLLFPAWNQNRSFLFAINAGFASRKIAFDEIAKPVSSNAEFFDNNSPEFCLGRRMIIQNFVQYSVFLLDTRSFDGHLTSQ